MKHFENVDMDLYMKMRVGSVQVPPTTKMTSNFVVFKSEPQVLEEENDGIQFWKVYFDFAYYCLMCPFRFIWDSERKQYLCYTNNIQTALRYTVFFLMGCCYLLRLVAMWVSSTTPLTPEIGNRTEGNHIEENPAENPTKYFDMTVYFFDSFFMLILFVHFGRRKNQVHQVFEELQKALTLSEKQNQNEFYISRPESSNKATDERVKNGSKYKKTRFWSRIILTGCMTTVGVKLLELLQDYDWNFKAFVDFKTQESKRMFIFENLVEAFPSIFIVLNVASSLFEKILNDYGDILITMSALLFQNLVNTFSHKISGRSNGNSGSNEANKVLEYYWWLKDLTSKINLAIGVMTFAFIVGNLPFFATTVLEVFGVETRNIFVRFRYIVACSYFFPTIFISAYASKKVETVKEWICKEENYSGISETKLSVFLHDLNFHTVGLSSFGILTLNWNSVGSIISIILTYALLKTQFKLGSHPESIPPNICNCTTI